MLSDVFEKKGLQNSFNCHELKRLCEKSNTNKMQKGL